MAANTDPLFGAVPIVPVPVTFASGDTTTKKTLADYSSATDYAYGAIVDSIQCCTDDTAAINLAVYRYNGSTDFYIGNINIPAGSGYTTVAAVEGMRFLSLDLGYILLPAGTGTAWLLRANCVATMTAAKILTITVSSRTLKAPT
ncbi:MAG TPA: hypothetical protein VF077_08790 [Nitrospiraceae bacterium]